MANLDVSDLMLDPDFGDTLTLITRTASVNQFGESELVETSSSIFAVVQQGTFDDLTRLPPGAQLSDTISVFFRSTLNLESVGGYADVVVWQGQRWQVKHIDEPYSHYGHGFTKAICSLEPAHV